MSSINNLETKITKAQKEFKLFITIHMEIATRKNEKMGISAKQSFLKN